MLSLQFPSQFACVQGFTSFSLSLYSVQALSWPSWFTQRNNISLPCTGSPRHDICILYTIYVIYMSSKPAVIGLVAKDWLSPKGAQLTSLSCSLVVLGCAWLCLAVQRVCRFSVSWGAAALMLFCSSADHNRIFVGGSTCNWPSYRYREYLDTQTVSHWLRK